MIASQKKFPTKSSAYLFSASAATLAPSRGLLYLALSFTTAHAAIANAVRPGVNTQAALHRIAMSMPVELQAVIDKNQIGLDSEDSETQKRTIKQAMSYLAFRKGHIREAQWSAACHKDASKKIENPFCEYDNERHERTHVSHTAATSKNLKRSIAIQLKSGNFDSIQKATVAEMIGGVAALGGMQAVRDLAEEVSNQKTCVNPAIPYALGYKLEEEFPDVSTVKLSKDLYRKSVDCGSDLASATASFRLALIDIWQNDCKDVNSLMLKTEKTPSASSYHARAKYWRYYCGDKEKNQVAMNDARSALLRDHPLSFQNLAINGEDTAGLGNVLQASDPQLAFRSLVRPDLNGILRASEAMLKLGNEPIATDMLDRRVSSINEMEPEVRLYTAVLLNRMGSALPKFKILSNLFDERPRMISLATMKLYFPLWYFDIVKIKQNEIDPLLILSLIRQESAFNKQARSTVGARGLMQVMPATARTVSRSGSRNLFDPKTNINVGTTYLMRKIQQYNGDVELTLAAYNAGFGRVDDWLKRYPTNNKMLFLDFIPFRETRDYVSIILRNYYWYVKLYDSTPTLELAKAGIAPRESIDAVPVSKENETSKTGSVEVAKDDASGTEQKNESDGSAIVNSDPATKNEAAEVSEFAMPSAGSPLRPIASRPVGPFPPEGDIVLSNPASEMIPSNRVAASKKGNRAPAGTFGSDSVKAIATSTYTKIEHSIGSRLGFATKAFKSIPKAAAIMSANAGIAAGVLISP